MTETVKIRSRSSTEKRRPSMFWVLASLILPLWSCMVRYRFTPDSKLPATGPFIMSPNHYSEIDPIAMGAAIWHLGRLPRFMAKESLFRVPVLGWLLRSSGQIPVRREGAVRDVYKRQISVGDLQVDFQIDDYTRWRLLEGLDDISLTLQNEQAITDFEAVSYTHLDVYKRQPSSCSPQTSSR